MKIGKSGIQEKRKSWGRMDRKPKWYRRREV